MSGTTVFLCEKRPAATDIANVMGIARSERGWYETKDGTIITWARGHLLRAYMPEEYDESYKVWAWENLPIIPDNFLFKPAGSDAAKQIKVIAGLLKRASNVVLATDAAREGELIGWQVLRRCGWKGPTKRFWANDLNPDAIKEALSNLRPIEETTPLAHAALARTCADWIVGMNLSPATKLKLFGPHGRGSISVGRVQTPTLRLIVDRELEIRNFRPETYFVPWVDVRSAQGHLLRLIYKAPPEAGRLTDRAAAAAIEGAVRGRSGSLRVTEEAKRQAPPALLDLSRAQQQCNIRFGLSAAKTLSVVQDLYEKHKLVTYPRTDFACLPEQQQNNFPQIAEHLLQQQAFSALAEDLRAPTFRKRHYDDSKIGDHHAIVPTHKAADLAELSDLECKVYLLIAAYYLAAHLPDHEYLSRSVSMTLDEHLFARSGTTPIKPGWRSAFGGEDEPSEDAAKKKGKGAKARGDEDSAPAVIPPVKDGEAATVADAGHEVNQTKPPSRFTEASLLNAMKAIANFVDDERAKKVLKSTSGLGTSATRDSIIEVLKKREYITISKRQITPSDAGIHLITSLRKIVPAYTDPVFTAFWEEKLQEIEKGEITSDQFLAAIKQKVTKDIQLLKESEAAVSSEETTPSSSPDAELSRGGGGTGAPGRSTREGRPATGRSKMLRRGPKQVTKVPLDISRMTRLKVPFERRDEAKALGARWHPETKSWYAPADAELDIFRKKSFL